MDVRQLRAVLAVVDEGTVTEAAAELHVSQPALSQTVRSLEAELGVDLFHRIGRRLVLSPAGQALLPSARQAVRAIDTARAQVAAVVGLAAGHLDLVSLPTLAVDPTARLIGAFRHAHPAVTVRLAEPEDTADVHAMLLDGRAEVGVADITAAALPDGLVAVPLFDQRYLAVFPAGSSRAGRRRIRIHDLVADPIVTTPRGSSTRQILEDAFAAVGATPNVAVESAQREALLPLVLAGAGSTLLPASLAAEAERRGASVAEVDPPLRRTVALLHRDGPLSPAAEAFVGLSDSRSAPGDQGGRRSARRPRR